SGATHHAGRTAPDGRGRRPTRSPFSWDAWRPAVRSCVTSWERGITTIMRWLQTEYILKGIYLGLLLDVALRQAERPATEWSAALTFAACTLGGLLLALTLAALWKLRQGYRIRGRLAPFILFLLLESPTLVYIGILGGTLLGAWLLREGETDPLFVQMV